MDNYENLINEIFDYYDKKPNKFARNVWLKYIKERLTLDELNNAVYLIISEEKFMPSPKEVVEKVKGSKSIDAKNTWFEILASDGKYDKFNPQIRKIIKKIGHIHLMNKSDLFKARQDFIELYMSEDMTKRKLLIESVRTTDRSNIPINRKALNEIEDFKNKFGS